MNFHSANAQNTSSRRLWLLGVTITVSIAMLAPQIYRYAAINGNALSLANGQPLPVTSISPKDIASGTNVEAYLQGIGLLESGEYDTAVMYLRLSAQQTRKQLSQRFLLQALAKSDLTKDASSLLDTMQLDADTLANIAQGLDPVDDNSLIRLLITEAVKQGTGSLGNVRWMGLWSLNHGSLPLGIQILESVSTYTDDYLWSQLGWAYFLSKDYEQAVHVFSHAVTLKPETTLYQLRLAQAYQARNKANDRLMAQKILKTLVSDHPNADAETWYTLGWNHYLLGEATDAIEAFEAVTQMAPNINLYRLRLAQALVQRGQPDDLDRAVAILRELTLDDPDLAEAMDLLSRLNVK